MHILIVPLTIIPFIISHFTVLADRTVSTLIRARSLDHFTTTTTGLSSKPTRSWHTAANNKNYNARAWPLASSTSEGSVLTRRSGHRSRRPPSGIEPAGFGSPPQEQESAGQGIGSIGTAELEDDPEILREIGLDASTFSERVRAAHANRAAREARVVRADRIARAAYATRVERERLQAPTELQDIQRSARFGVNPRILHEAIERERLRITREGRNTLRGSGFRLNPANVAGDASLLQDLRRLPSDLAALVLSDAERHATDEAASSSSPVGSSGLAQVRATEQRAHSTLQWLSYQSRRAVEAAARESYAQFRAAGEVATGRERPPSRRASGAAAVADRAAAYGDLVQDRSIMQRIQDAIRLESRARRRARKEAAAAAAAADAAAARGPLF